MASPDSARDADAYPSPSKQAAALHAFLQVKNPRVSPHLANAVIQELLPSRHEPVKGLANRLKPVMARFGVRLKHTPALEAAARIQGQVNWHTTPTYLREADPETADATPSPFRRAAGVYAVENPEVTDVLDRSTGRYERHSDVIGDDWEKALQLRLQVQTDLEVNPRFLCSQCMTPVYLVSRPESKKLFFRHTLEDGRCSAVTRGLLSQEEIDARKYNGVKESWLHIEMKRWIVECLRADGRFTDIVVEGRWTGEFTGAWRKPDVRATFNGVPVAFEIQLSTTYINVIAQRREFYRREGGLLFWVFSQFNMGARRLTQDDVFYNNNRNAFVVSSRTRDESLQQQRFMLDCIWAEPTVGGGVTDLRRELVTFETLTLEQDAQRAYHYDFDGERERLAREVRESRLARLAPLREKFETWYTAYVTTKESDNKTWGELRRAIAAEGISLPEYTGMLPRGLLNLLYSTKHGRVVGWDFTSFIQIAHYVEPGHRKFLHYFRAALKAFGRAEQIRAEDQSGKWAAKVAEYKARIRACDPDYAPDTEHDALVRLLFPEMFVDA